MGILLAGGMSIGKIMAIGGLVILIIGLFSGGAKSYDQKDKNQLTHAAKLSDTSYAPKGSGRWKDKHGNVRSEDIRKK